MLRTLFLAAGFFVLLIGGGLSQVDEIVLNSKGKLAGDYRGLLSVNDDGQHVLDPPDWAPFSLVAIGGVFMLYAGILPRRRRERD